MLAAMVSNELPLAVAAVSTLYLGSLAKCISCIAVSCKVLLLATCKTVSAVDNQVQSLVCVSGREELFLVQGQPIVLLMASWQFYRLNQMSYLLCLALWLL